jgi:MoaA/NifB/PqqE/SkfB family radical SAM enzyme
LDGPRDIQNRQRPRRDGCDSFDGPVRLARAVLARHKKLIIKTTVTRFSVDRISEVVQFVAREIGAAHLQLSMMFFASQVEDPTFGPPPWEDYVREFGKALDLGARLGVKVSHPQVAYESLCCSNSGRLTAPFCLVPPRTVTAFFDVPEGVDAGSLGTYGHYDPEERTICFDHERRRQIGQAEPWDACQSCPCCAACIGTGGVRGRIPMAAPLVGPECQARLGVLKELVRRSVPKPIVKEETIT